MLDCLISPRCCYNSFSLSLAGFEMNPKVSMAWRLCLIPGSTETPFIDSFYVASSAHLLLMGTLSPCFTPISCGLLCGSPRTTDHTEINAGAPQPLEFSCLVVPPVSFMCLQPDHAVAVALLGFSVDSAPWRFILFRAIYWAVYLMERKYQMLQAAQGHKSVSHISMKYVIVFIILSKQFYTSFL